METLLPAFFTIAKERGADAARMTAEHLSERPASSSDSIPRKGVLQAGADADIASSRKLKRSGTPRAPKMGCTGAHMMDVGLPDGWCAPISAAELAYDGKSIVNRPGAGRFVARGTSRWFQQDNAQ